MLITDVRPGEPDLLVGYELEALEIRSNEGYVLHRILAQQPWTHERLLDAIAAHSNLIHQAASADFYLGSQFVGSTEI